MAYNVILIDSIIIKWRESGKSDYCAYNLVTPYSPLHCTSCESVRVACEFSKVAPMTALSTQVFVFVVLIVALITMPPVTLPAGE
jgi:hypothetical protein